MYRLVRGSDSSDSQYAIALIDNKSGDILGYVSGYRKGGYYHPGDIVQCVYDESDNSVKIYADPRYAQRAASQYRNYSEVFMYDYTSSDYPMPSEKWKKKDVPTHLEVVETTADKIASCTISARTESADIAQMRTNAAQARKILKTFDPEKVRYVQKCMDDINREYSRLAGPELSDDELELLNVQAIKTDWLIGAIEDDLMTEDEFEEIFSWLEVLDTEKAHSQA